MPAFTAADRAQCEYEAQVATLNSCGILIPIAEYNHVLGYCLRARLAAEQ